MDAHRQRASGFLFWPAARKKPDHTASPPAAGGCNPLLGLPTGRAPALEGHPLYSTHVGDEPQLLVERHHLLLVREGGWGVWGRLGWKGLGFFRVEGIEGAAKPETTPTQPTPHQP